MKMRVLLATLLATIVSVAYADDDHKKNYISVDVAGIEYFENIISNAPFDVEFTQRDVQKVSVYGDPNQVNNVTVTLVGKTLYVGAQDNAPVSHVKLVVTAPDLLCAIASGSGDIDVKNLNNSKFTATVTGSGDIELTGTCDQAVYTINGSGDIDGEEFRVDHLEATVNGSGSIDCRCVDTLNANVVGSGEIEIHGPTRMVNRAGRKAAIRHDH
ncbi:MAG: DUF2807 domain-containing protein [Bacteroidales bacterium]|nr:DUF2807 domain-containing protein [Bacteroidales bacterium]MBP3670982.1 DUF2807 domain-containing protein [Bacteroidaceae bacterium]